MNADYEEMLLQVTDVLKAHNRYHLKTPDHEQAVKIIREIVTPKGKWIFDSKSMFGSPYGSYKCSNCGKHTDDNKDNWCWFCGARMESDV